MNTSDASRAWDGPTSAAPAVLAVLTLCAFTPVLALARGERPAAADDANATSDIAMDVAMDVASDAASGVVTDAASGAASDVVTDVVTGVDADADRPRAGELRVLGERRVQSVVTVTALSAAAAFTAYTYVTPLLTHTLGVSAPAVTVLLLLFGIGGTVGNLIGGKLADRSVTGAVRLGVLVLAGSLLLLGASANVRPVAIGSLFLFGAAYYAVIPAVNTRMLNVASQRARNLALTVQSSAFNLGIAVGGWLGGQVIAMGAALRWVPVAGGLVALLALAVACAEHRGERRRTASTATRNETRNATRNAVGGERGGERNPNSPTEAAT